MKVSYIAMETVLRGPLFSMLRRRPRITGNLPQLAQLPDGLSENADFLLSLSGNPISHFISSISKRSRGMNLKEGQLHPARAFSQVSTVLARSINDFAKVLALEPFGDWLPELSNGLTSKFKYMVYCAAEYFEVLEKSIPNSLSTHSGIELRNLISTYEDRVKILKRDWSLICNRIKHNHNFLAPGGCTYEKFSMHVCGFTLMVPCGDDHVEVNEDLHQPPERIRAFNIATRKLIYDILAADKTAGDLVLQLEDEIDAAHLGEWVFEFQIGEAIKTIDKIFPLPVDADGGITYEIAILDDRLTMGLARVAVNSNVKRRHFKFFNDSFARSHALPFNLETLEIIN